MSEGFIPDTHETAITPASSSSNASTESFPSQEPVKVLVIGSPRGVNSTIRTLYRLGFAEVTAWSPLQPTSNPGEVMSVLYRKIRIY